MCKLYGMFRGINKLRESIPFLQSNPGSACLSGLSISLL